MAATLSLVAAGCWLRSNLLQTRQSPSFGNTNSIQNENLAFLKKNPNLVFVEEPFAVDLKNLKSKNSSKKKIWNYIHLIDPRLDLPFFENDVLNSSVDNPKSQLLPGTSCFFIVARSTIGVTYERPHFQRW